MPQQPLLPELTGFVLRLAYAKAVDCAQECLGDSAVRELVLLVIVSDREPLPQRALADLMQLSPTLVVDLVDAVERNGWVERRRNPQDRRSYTLWLTDEGRAVGDQHRIELDKVEAAMTGVLTAAEQKRLHLHLGRLLAAEGVEPVAALAHHTGFLVAGAHRLLRARAVEEMRPLGIQPRDFGVMSVLAHEQPCSQNHLAQRLGVSPPAVLSFVDALEAAGLVRRERNPADRRVYDVTLTEAGAETLAEAQRIAAGLQRRVTSALGPTADRELRTLLMRIVEAS